MLEVVLPVELPVDRRLEMNEEMSMRGLLLGEGCWKSRPRRAAWGICISFNQTVWPESNFLIDSETESSSELDEEVFFGRLSKLLVGSAGCWVCPPGLLRARG